MGKIIIIQPDKECLSFYEYLLAGEFENEVLGFTNLELAMTNINNQEKIAIILLNDNIPNYKLLIDQYYQRNADYPLAIITSSSVEKRNAQLGDPNSNIRYFKHNQNIQQMIKSLCFMTNKKEREKGKSHFCKLNISFFYTIEKAPCDIFIKISNEKHVKIFNRLSLVDIDKLKSYEQKGAKYFFVQLRDFKIIINELSNKLNTFFKESSKSNFNGQLIANTQVSTLIPMHLQETVFETIQQIGLNNKALELTGHAIDSTMKIISKNTKISKLLENTIKNDNYITEHSLLSSFISCAICKETQWNNDQSMTKLCIASFFHDIQLDNDEWAKINSTQSEKYKELSTEEKRIILGHPQYASELVTQITGVPSDVKNIILQHHERADGSGFPRGVSYKQITPLSGIFTISHELSAYIYSSGTAHENIQEIIMEFREKYNKGNFKAILDALDVVFSSNSSLKIAS